MQYHINPHNMKKFVICIAIAASCMDTFAQDIQEIQKAAAQAMLAAPDAQVKTKKPTYWTNSIDFTIGFGQTALTSWAEGGYNTASLTANVDAKANYSKELMKWNNRLQLDYGFLWSADKADILQKSKDRIYLESKWSYKTGKNSTWSYSASFDFKTQFTNGYDNYKKSESGHWEGTLKSGFISPGYTNVALGMDWAPLNWFDMSISPVTGGFTLCSIESLRKNYGMALSQDGISYRSAKFQFGTQVKANASVSINEVFNFETQLVLFTDYLEKPFAEIRVNWDNKITWKIAKYFKVGLDTWLIYDPAVTITRGEESFKSLVQFKESLAISFIYTIANK